MRSCTRAAIRGQANAYAAIRCRSRDFSKLRHPLEIPKPLTYYKAVNTAVAPDYQDLVDVNYAVSLQGGTSAQGGTSRWVDNMCPNDWDWPISGGTGGSPTNQEITSEIDWMRFFWAFVASQQPGIGDPASVSDIFDVLATANWTQSTVWIPLVDAIENHPDSAVSDHSDRFQDLNDDNGVFNDD